MSHLALQNVIINDLNLLRITDKYFLKFSICYKEF